MHVHLPKPLHGWREFVGEVGIIVLGVLLALGAEQLVETLDWRHRVDAAEASMVQELGDDDGAQAHSRVIMSACFDAHLANVERALLFNRDKGSRFTPAALPTPAFRTWDSDAWRAAVSSGATSHMSADKMSRWSSPYTLVSDMNEVALREYNDWADLSRIETLRARPSELEREAMLSAIARARKDNQLLTLMARYFLLFSDRAGVRASDVAVEAETRRERLVTNGC